MFGGGTPLGGGWRRAVYSSLHPPPHSAPRTVRHCLQGSQPVVGMHPTAPCAPLPTRACNRLLACTHPVGRTVPGAPLLTGAAAGACTDVPPLAAGAPLPTGLVAGLLVCNKPPPARHYLPAMQPAAGLYTPRRAHRPRCAITYRVCCRVLVCTQPHDAPPPARHSYRGCSHLPVTLPTVGGGVLDAPCVGLRATTRMAHRGRCALQGGQKPATASKAGEGCTARCQPIYPPGTHPDKTTPRGIIRSAAGGSYTSDFTPPPPSEGGTPPKHGDKGDISDISESAACLRRKS